MTSTADAPRLLTDSVRHAESPRWHDGRLWFSDVHDYKVKNIDLEGRIDVVAEAPAKPSGIGRMPDGRWLLVTSVDRKLSWVDGGELREACDLSPGSLGPITEMVVDGHGRAYISDTGFSHGAGDPHRLGRVHLFTEEHGSRIVAEDTDYANGSAVSPDGRRFFLAESFGRRVSVFDIDDDGGLANRRVFAEFDELTDGLCLDAGGGMWVALPTASEFVHLDADGRIDDRIATPGRMAIACVLGGPNGRTLFLCSVHSTVETLSLGLCDGVIEAIEVDVPGAGWP